MTKLTENLMEVEKLREHLQTLIEKKGEVSDVEILNASRMLDVLLNEYYCLLKSNQIARP